MPNYLSRLTSSSRGERFNSLMYPFLLATLAYGVGFVAFAHTDGVQDSSLFMAMHGLQSFIPWVWGVFALLTIVVGITFLLFNVPPAGRLSGLTGFMVWIFAILCWAITGAWLLVFAVGIPNAWFWFWQYFSLSRFRKQEMADAQSMRDYDEGKYDDDNGGKALRESNRGKDLQVAGSYEFADNGDDLSRPLN